MKRMHPVFALLITAALSTVSSPAQPVLAAFGSGSSAGGWTSNNSFPRRLADVNGDGKADIVGFANDGVYVALSQGNTFAPLSKWIAQYCPTIGGWANDDSFPRMLGDVNGDGKADIVGFGDTAVFVSLSTGAGFSDPVPWANLFSVKAGGWTNNNQNPRLVADVNGDGKADIVGFAYDGAYVSLSSGTSFGAQSKWASSYGPGPAAGTWENNDTYPRWAADVNGDGKADIIGFGVAGVYVSLSSGSAFSAPVLWLSAMGTAPAAGGWQGLVHPRMIADVNGDKKADAIGFANDGVYVALSSGSAFQPLVKWNSGFAVNSGPWPTDDLAPRLVGDFSGNRQADIVGFAFGRCVRGLQHGQRFQGHRAGAAGRHHRWFGERRELLLESELHSRRGSHRFRLRRRRRKGSQRTPLLPQVSVRHVWRGSGLLDGLSSGLRRHRRFLRQASSDVRLRLQLEVGRHSV